MKKLKRYTMVIIAALTLTAAVLSMSGCGKSKDDVAIPILMYHHISDTEQAYTMVSTAKFAEQLDALKNAGYETVTAKQVIDYVNDEGTLPKKPVMITFDDGYESNLTLGAPLLEERGMCATVFSIAITMGRAEHPVTGEPIDPPRYDWPDALPWIEKGVIEIQSHTYDMHNRFEFGGTREGVLQNEGESDEDYAAAIKADADAVRELFEDELGIELYALSYPHGLYTEKADALLKENGVLLTVCSESGVSVVTKGNADSMRMMKRIVVWEDMSGDKLVSVLSRQIRAAK